MRWLLALLLLMLPLAALAQQPLHDPQPLQFRNGAEERRFHDLAAQLRCVQCQNQSLADSDALIAQDMRRQVLALMQQGQSDSQIRAYLVQRYGQFVLYRPALSAATIALWLVPGLLLICGALLAWRVIARRQHLLAEHPLPPSGDDW